MVLATIMGTLSLVILVAAIFGFIWLDRKFLTRTDWVEILSGVFVAAVVGGMGISWMIKLGGG
jgi:hypothetical protein